MSGDGQSSDRRRRAWPAAPALVLALVAAPTAAAETAARPGSPGAHGGEEATVSGLDPGACKPYFAKPGPTFGGYGSFLYEKFTGTRDDETPADEPSRASLTEAWIYLGYRFDEHWLFNASIGIEDAIAGDGEDGEAAVEFAYVDYRRDARFGARGGLVLLPLGFLNERHEPNAFLGTMRPLVEQRVVPTTWREPGGGVYGAAGPVEWRAFLTAGLDASGFEEGSGVAEGRQQGSGTLAADLALSARVDWTPLRGDRTGTLLVGASAVTCETGQDLPGLPAGRFTLWDAHLSYRRQGLWARALVARGVLSDAGEISLAIDATGDTAIGERMKGWYVEAGYEVLRLFDATRQALVPFCRYESLDPQSQVAPGFTADRENNLTVRTCGLAWNPIPQVRLTADATNYDQKARTAVDQVNLGLGWAF